MVTQYTIILWVLVHFEKHRLFLSTTELNNSVEDHSSSRVGVECRLSSVVCPILQHAIISKHFELEGWNFVWRFPQTWQASFSSRIKIGPPQPPYHPRNKCERLTTIFLSNVNEIWHGSHLWRDTTKKKHKVSGPCLTHSNHPPCPPRNHPK